HAGAVVAYAPLNHDVHRLEQGHGKVVARIRSENLDLTLPSGNRRAQLLVDLSRSLLTAVNGAGQGSFLWLWLALCLWTCSERSKTSYLVSMVPARFNENRREMWSWRQRVRWHAATGCAIRRDRRASRDGDRNRPQGNGAGPPPGRGPSWPR